MPRQKVLFPEKGISQEELLNLMEESRKDDIKWRAANIKVITAMNQGVANIYGWLTRDEVGFMNENQKLAQEQLKAALIGNEAMSKLIDTNSAGNIKIEYQ